MNCRPGDLAVIARRGNEPCLFHLTGLIVRVVEIVGQTGDGELCWSYEGRRLRCAHGWTVFGLPDVLLKPIRPDAGEDETLTWAGKPACVDAETVGT